MTAETYPSFVLSVFEVWECMHLLGISSSFNDLSGTCYYGTSDPAKE